ncbi:tRNA pseudouridine(55) synthase TruB [Carboxylicivirga linearis]|uniref:tRNA pseudouridine synthase B n=1 Tax=Carboxylicivirga linearis TaxID=1628157 RepID=A0ABS5JV04_9BACT|nr:tRNA pseudouridine(55) synthase TruB [Carboxylicivirga linearis]MBS2098737.1 tRNA pseudouridine(55) synthase TruB [Carboxylicivirga linearis]
MEFSAEYFQAGQVLLIDKPLEWTSFDVVNKIRYSLKRYLNIKKIKVGHAGTLDPLATGLVIVCTGKATKQIEQFSGLDKQYIADVELGSTTPTYDKESEPDAIYSWEHITEELVQEKLELFRGDIEQIPPIYSALKVKGVKAYDLARKGKDVEMKARKIHISKLELIEFGEKHLKLDVSCSKGTYIRSLAYDLGVALNSGAHLSGLVRTRIGDYQLKDAISIFDFEKKLASFVTK